MYAELAVVFDPDTGETHFLSDLPAILLEQIDVKPMALAELIDKLDAPAELGPDAHKQVLSTLLSLEQAELITSKSADHH